MELCAAALPATPMICGSHQNRLIQGCQLVAMPFGNPHPRENLNGA